MDRIFEEAVEKYQCTGCINGSNISCFQPSTDSVGCSNHKAGTIIVPYGPMLLGMPTGFCRLGSAKDLIPSIYSCFEDMDWDYVKWNVPVWKYLTKDNHTIVRGLSPRNNSTFIHIFLENCLDKINCLEITEEDIAFMD